MTDKSRRAGSLAVLAAGILLSVALVVIFLVPLANCRACEVDRAVQRGLESISKSKPFHQPEFAVCDLCWKGRLTLYRKWTLDRDSGTQPPR